jgi:hypothetical protein
MNNWIEIDQDEKRKIWDYIYLDLSFKPYNSKGQIVILSEPKITYDIGKYFNEGFSEKIYDDLHLKFLNAFKNIVNQAVFVYSLDFQHNCYKFSPCQDIDLDEFGEWLISPFPNGDILFFLTEDYKNIYVGEGINHDIYIGGAELVNEFLKNKPLIFG